MQTTTTTPKPRVARDYLSYQIQYLAREIGARPTADGTQQAYIVELFAALIAAGVSVDALYCALEDAAEVEDCVLAEVGP